MAKKKYKNKMNAGIANEQIASWIAKKRNINQTIRIASLAELEERNRELTRNFSALQRMEYLLKLNINLYGFDWSEQINKLRSGKLIIRKPS